MRKVVITGVTGQDGPYLIEALRAQGPADIVGVVRRCARSVTDDLGIEILEGDVRDPAITDRVAELWPDEIYNLAAMSHVGHSFDCAEDVMQTNAIGALHMLEAAKKSNARFYQASTSEIFGNSLSPGPQNEDTPLAPTSPYAIAKTAAYHMVRMYRKAYGVYACNGILFNHESPRRGVDFVTQKVCQAAVRISQGDQEYLRIGDGNARRDWGHAQDYARGMVAMMQADEPGDYVLATGVSRSVWDLCKVAFGKVCIEDWEKHVIYDAKFARPSDVWHLCGDAGKAHRELKWSARIGFEEMIGEMIVAYAREHYVDFGRDRSRLPHPAVRSDHDGRALLSV